MHYSEYLKLDKILEAQFLESSKKQKPAHDEMLFIIIHQVYELWFKQILFELESIRTIFKKEIVDDQELGVIVSRISRCNKILKLLVDQVSIIETMTPSAFLEFRDLLNPASGFQSLQFRKLETILGLKLEDRSQIERKFFNSRLKPNEQAELNKALSEKSLKELVNSWLSRLELIDTKGFSFWKNFKQTVDIMLKNDSNTIKNNKTLNDIEKDIEIKNLESIKSSFNVLFNQDEYEKADFSLSRRSMLAALFITTYQDYPLMHLPYKIISSLLEMDEWITKWRYAHALMVKRMLGQRIGTGGSSGHEYLRKTAEKHVLFADFFKLNTFLIPKSKRPELPKEIQELLGYHYQVSKR